MVEDSLLSYLLTCINSTKWNIGREIANIDIDFNLYCIIFLGAYVIVIVIVIVIAFIIAAILFFLDQLGHSRVAIICVIAVIIIVIVIVTH